jgi:hypothetical protein
MGTPVVETCLSSLITALEGITTGNGYHTDVKRVTRLGVPPWSAGEFPYISVVGLGESKESRSSTVVTVDGTFTLGLFMDSGEDDPQTKMINFMCDVEKAAMADMRRGGNAIWTKILDTEVMVLEEEDPYLASRVVVGVRYRHTLGDPEVAR